MAHTGQVWHKPAKNGKHSESMAHAGRVMKAGYGTHRQGMAHTGQVWHKPAKNGTHSESMAHRQGREGRVWHTQAG
ncbi:hypothetical protein XENTR_v10013722 [Xenopus tropicalis]|nr:hypothetical protein XENTR_v10013722 [Xenopus tropicalis]